MLSTVILTALVTYVSVDGVYLNEGRADGVRVGDVVKVGRTKLEIAEVSAHRARTTPPSNPFKLKVGAKARIKRGAKAARKRAAVGKRPPQPPRFDPQETGKWWESVADGWTKPRELPKLGPRKEVEAHWTGKLGFWGGATDAHESRAFGAAYTALAFRQGRWSYDHDLRLHPFSDAQRYAPPLIDARRLEGQFRGEGWGLQAGRLWLGDTLAPGALDGAAVAVGPGRLFFGFAPDPLNLYPGTVRPQVGASVEHAADLGAVQATIHTTALLSLFDSAIDRTALAPSVTLHTKTFRFTGRAEIDAYLDAQPEGRGVVDPTRLYASVNYRPIREIDFGLRYDRSRPAPSRALLEIDAPYLQTVRDTGWVDVRLDGGRFGYILASCGAYDDQGGYAIVPGADYGVALARWLDFRTGWFRRDAPHNTLDHVRGRLMAHSDGAWPLAVELGGRLVRLRDRDRPDLDEEERTVEAGLRWSTPAKLDFVLTAERTDATTPRTLIFGDVQWRFGQ